MWIDEMFRDMKSGLGLGRNRITSRLLEIVILAYIFIMMGGIANASDQLILRIAKRRKRGSRVKHIQSGVKE
jgi:hypothetical protein